LPKIIELEQHIADLIAAGEVVQRPASVVKELIENSIDSGASIITIEIASGGMSYIRVTDDGCGIAAEDAKTAFLRHATSKLRDAEGLAAIGTLGFRGEALAAIAAVSRIELLTRESGAVEGISLTLDAGDVIDMSPAGCPEGTTIIVRDLFFNTPARLKFAKSDRAEGASIASVVLRSALSRPDISFRFIKDGKPEYHTPGDSRVESCIYSLLGREVEAGFLGVESYDEAVSVRGFVSSPEAARGNRSYQFFFINGRVIRSLLLQSALEQAYKNTLPTGKFPSCVLYIKIKPCDVDVNVHPAKTEVKFVSDKQVFDCVYYAALGALEESKFGGREKREEASGFGLQDLGAGKDIRPWRVENISAGSEGQESGFKIQDLGAVKETAENAVYASPGSENSKEDRGYASPGSEIAEENYSFKAMQADDFRKVHVAEPSHVYKSPSNPAQVSYPPAYSMFDSNVTESGESAYSLSSAEPFRVIGEALNVYIIVEFQESVWFIDKHAAHERLHFDALRNGNYEPMSESLITPVICYLGHEDASTLLENAAFLEVMGFTVESFGVESVAVRHIPADIDIGDTESVLSDICVQLKHSGAAEPAERDNIFKTIACKAAIKAGRASGLQELEALAAKVISGKVSQCPHGRPVAFEVTKATLDKGFGRI